MMAPAPIRPRKAASHRWVRRNLLILVLLELATGGGAFVWSAQADPLAPKAPADTTSAVADSTAPHRVLAYYFHTTYRCTSCQKIEAYTTEAITTGFAEELKDGRLVFRVLNIQEKENEHFVKDYQLFTKSVVLVDELSGKQAGWKNLPKVWELLNDKEKFVRYIQEETRAYLSGKQS